MDNCYYPKFRITEANHVITHIEHLIEDAGNEIERIADEEKNIDSRG